MEVSDYIAVAGVIFFAISEIIGMSKLKENSVIQLALSILTKIFPYKKGG